MYLPAPWCFSTMLCFPKLETFTKSESLGPQNLKNPPNQGRGSQNRKLLQNLRVEVPKT